MPTLVVPKTYRNNEVLREADLDNIRSSILTFFNVTRLDATNLQLTQILSSLTSPQIDAFLGAASSANVDTFLSNASVGAAEGLIAKSDIIDDSDVEADAAVAISGSSPTTLISVTGLEGTFILVGTVGVSTTTGTYTAQLRKNGTTVGATTEFNASLLTATFIAVVTLEPSDTVDIQAQRQSASGSALVNPSIYHVRVR